MNDEQPMAGRDVECRAWLTVALRHLRDARRFLRDAGKHCPDELGDLLATIDCHMAAAVAALRSVEDTE